MHLSFVLHIPCLPLLPPALSFPLPLSSYLCQDAVYRRHRLLHEAGDADDSAYSNKLQSTVAAKGEAQDSVLG